MGVVTELWFQLGGGVIRALRQGKSLSAGLSTSTIGPVHTRLHPPSLSGSSYLMTDCMYLCLYFCYLLQDLVFGVYLISATSSFLSFLSSIWFFLFPLFSLHIATVHPCNHFLCLQRLNRIHFWVLSDLNPLPWGPPMQDTVCIIGFVKCLCRSPENKVIPGQQNKTMKQTSKKFKKRKKLHLKKVSFTTTILYWRTVKIHF